MVREIFTRGDGDGDEPKASTHPPSAGLDEMRLGGRLGDAKDGPEAGTDRTSAGQGRIRPLGSLSADQEGPEEKFVGDCQDK